MNRPRFLAITLLLGTGLVGLLGGVVLERSVLGATPPQGDVAVERSAEAGSDEGDRQCESRESSRSWHSRVSRDLDLTEAQTAELERLLQAQRQRLNATMDGIRPRMKEIVAETHAEFLELLTPEQRARFDELRSRSSDHGHSRDDSGSRDHSRSSDDNRSPERGR
ncbi:MAG: hypothetical protein WEA09_08160 [Gemmatimonadota bacterium]